MNKTRENLRLETLAFTKQLAEQYLVRRELEQLTQFMDEHISWIGTGGDEISRSLAEASKALSRELAEYSGSFTVAEESLEAIPCSDSLCIVYGAIRAVPDEPSLSEENLRLSLVVRKDDDAMRMVHLHLSHPDQDQERGHYYVSRSARNDTHSLRQTLDLRSRQLDILNRNIPGGAHQCKNDPNFTLISMSDSFLAMFGYSREEIKTLFHNHFIEMVYPGDRAMMLSTAYEQLQHGRDIEVEYRVLCKNGPPVWILDKGRLMEDGNGGENFYCLLLEITSRKQAQEELRLSLERHQVIMDQATDIIFEWDIGRDTLSFSPNWRKKFGYDAIDAQISGRIPLSQNIHPDDISAFVKIMRDTAAGVPYSETEFRIRNLTGRYYWCRIRATTQFDAYKRPIKAVGVIVDIDDEKKQKQQLLEMAQRDALTGLYNKMTINSLVERRMEKGGLSSVQALLILDVDNFKAVNDTYGHLAGDNLLSDVAAVVKGHIRATDLAGRIGGDEFLVYLPEIQGEAAACAKAESLLAALSRLVPEPGAPTISCSIGAAVFPHGDIDFYELYKCADLALYARKNSGRRGVTLYTPDINQKQPCGMPESAVSNMVASDDGNVMDEQLSQYAFRVLYSAKDIEPALSRLLEIIGRSYDVSRAYIFESSEDGKTCSNTFEWCATGVTSQIENLQNISYDDDLGNYLKNFNEKGLFYCPEVRSTYPELRAILEPQGICSMLQCAMIDEGEFVGYVGFDECRDNRAWSPRQVAAFKLTADVLSSFLIKLRQKQKLKKQAADVQRAAK